MKELPSEIVECISFYVSVPDLLNSIIVSKSWFHSFYRFLFKSVHIGKQERLEIVATAFDCQGLPGHLVRTLSLTNVELSQQTLDQYKQLFPYLDTLRALSIKTSPTLCLLDHVPLRVLVLDTLHLEQDTACLLRHTSSLQTLELLNLKEQVTLSYLEMIHQTCPQLTALSLDCRYADPQPATLFNESEGHDRELVPCQLDSFSLSCQSGASKWSFWLPYLALKYPLLNHLYFKHQGNRSACSFLGAHHDTLAFCHAFAKRCRQLKRIQWDRIAVHGEQAARLYQPNLSSIQAHENFSMTHSILQVPTISSLITSLSLSQVPSVKAIELVGKQCSSLTQLEIQDTKGIDGLLQIVLAHCPLLALLKIQGIHLTTLADTDKQHRLNRLVLSHCSFEQGLFQAVSRACRALCHIELTACVQSDTRSQIQIDLGQHQLETLKIKALRTRQFYPGCRVQFFAVNQDWYHMSKYVVEDATQLETALEWNLIDISDTEKLLPLVTDKPLKAWDIEHIKQRIGQTIEGVESLYYSGLVSIQCCRVKNLFINDLKCHSLKTQ